MSRRLPIERPVALSGRPVLTRSARALGTAEDLLSVWHAIGGHQAKETASAERRLIEERIAQRTPTTAVRRGQDPANARVAIPKVDCDDW
jgi:hypothetical protein